MHGLIEKRTEQRAHSNTVECVYCRKLREQQSVTLKVDQLGYILIKLNISPPVLKT